MILEKKNLSEFIKKYIKSYEEGFTDLECSIILYTYENIDSKKFYSCMRGHTCIATEKGLILNYEWDVEAALYNSIIEK